MNTELAEKAEQNELPAYYLNGSSKFDMKTLGRLKHVIRQNNADIICSHGFKSDFYNFAVSKLTDIRKVVFVRGDTKENLKILFYTYLDKQIIRHFDHVITLSETQKNNLIRANIPSDNISVVYNSVDIEEVERCASEEAGDLSIPAEIISNGHYIVTVGRLSPEKGHRVLVDAMPFIIQEHPQITLVMIGEGQERTNLEQQIKEKGLKEHVLMPGFSRNAPYYMKRARLFVNPSYSEGMPNVVLEARALKVPVVATKVGGVSEIISNNEGCLLVPPGDPERLAIAINKLLSDSKATKELDEDAYSHFRDKFDADSQTVKLIAIYEKLRNTAAVRCHK